MKWTRGLLVPDQQAGPSSVDAPPGTGIKGDGPVSVEAGSVRQGAGGFELMEGSVAAAGASNAAATRPTRDSHGSHRRPVITADITGRGTVARPSVSESEEFLNSSSASTTLAGRPVTTSEFRN
jgi:hypothetical protein